MLTRRAVFMYVVAGWAAGNCSDEVIRPEPSEDTATVDPEKSEATEIRAVPQE